MPDSLKRMVDTWDRAHAPRSRIEPERLILPARPDASSRLSCTKCWKVTMYADAESVEMICMDCGGRLAGVTA